MPSDLLFKATNGLHRVVLKVTFGKLGWHALKMPVVELTTTGRKSHQPRTVLVTSPLQEGDTVVIVASRGGDDANPAWLLNLRADPNVRASVGGAPTQAMVAHEASAEERARLWPLITSEHGNYAGYQAKTTREIPLVLLRPAA